MLTSVNLGGEGEIPGVLNQQPEWVEHDQNWFAARGSNRTLADLIADGHRFVFCPNLPLPFPDEFFDVVYTSGVPLDRRTVRGPGVQKSEIERILKRGGKWINDGDLEWTKP